MSTSSKPHRTTQEIQKTRARFRQFRILVIGRANAGKTTILRKVCNTTGNPIIFDPEGNKIESSTLDPSRKRGEHDIENQMVFESNPGFVFHDSRGFEAGGDRELKLVQQFIEQRSKVGKVKEQLHAIWYCIPTTDDRPITAAEKKFFNECGTGLVPVIVLWTKTDYLDVDKFNELIRKGTSKSDARQQAPEKAWADFEKNILPRFSEFKYPPKGYVAFRKMDEPGGDCNELIERTAEALSGEQLQQFFLSTQQNNVDACLKYGVRNTMRQTQLVGRQIFKDKNGNWAYFMVMVLNFFPHLWGTTRDGADWWGTLAEEWFTTRGGDWWGTLAEEWFTTRGGDWGTLALDSNDKFMDSVSKTMSFSLSGLSTKFNLKEATYCAIVAAIIGHLSFFLKKDKSLKSLAALDQAVQMYQQSSSDLSVKKALEHLFEGYHPVQNHGILNLFKRPRVDERPMLVEGGVQIALNNRLYTK